MRHVLIAATMAAMLAATPALASRHPQAAAAPARSTFTDISASPAYGDWNQPRAHRGGRHHAVAHRRPVERPVAKVAALHPAAPASAPVKPAAAPATPPAAIPQVKEAALDEYVPGAPQPLMDIDDARDYLVATVEEPGGTMQRQGIRLSIERLHPAFAVRLAAAIREAQDGGMKAYVFSAYRPPEYGVGGYRNKFDSAHTYGLAVDMAGIGEPCSADARKWQLIAGRHGLYLPYGSCNRAEWNHTQLMAERGQEFVSEHRGLRREVSASGPLNMLAMWVASGIKRTVAAIDLIVADRPKIAVIESERPRHIATRHSQHHYAHHGARHRYASI